MFLTIAGANVSSVLPPYQQLVQGKDDKESDYEQRVRKFLEQTKGDDDYEEKVRKFLDETAKWYVNLFFFFSIQFIMFSPRSPFDL